MDRNCENCEKNGFQEANSCGYLPKEKRQGSDVFFGATHDINMFVPVCPVWYYNEYTDIYRIFNLTRVSSLNFLELDFIDRFVFEVGTIYLKQKEEEKKRLEGK